MLINQARRLNREQLAADQNALDAVRDLADYTAVNPTYTTERLNALDAAFQSAEQNERRLQIALDAARDATVAAAWERHNAILGAKTQVIAQYGPNANAVQALGLKKKSERRRPTRRMVATEA